MTQLALRRPVEWGVIQAAVLAGVLTAAAVAWLVLAKRMAGMDAGPGGDPGTLGWFAVTWAVMTAAMMLPAVAPAVLQLVRALPSKGAIAAIPFIAGYGAVWMLAGTVGFAVVTAVRGLHPGLLGWSSAGRFVAAASLVAAGLYQLTGLKRRWLARCGSPDLTRLGRRTGGALIAGAEHGGCCVACCWTLMAALHALGIMSITWMAVITIVIAGERILPRSAISVRAVAVVLVVLAIGLATAPAAVPGLTIPLQAHPMMMG